MLSPCPFSSQHLLSSTHHLMFPLRLSRIREVKMIPRSMWRQRADSSSTRDKEKESKRWGHLERLKKETDQHLCLVPAHRAEETSREECRLHSDIPRSEFQTSSRSKLWKVNKINYLQNQICSLSTKYARRCILEAFGACFGLGMDSKCMGQVDGRI
ncbi:hypothetical protein ACFX12_022859 [Malus domestica]